MKKLLMLSIGFSFALSACGPSAINIDDKKAEAIRRYNTVRDTASVPDPVHGIQAKFAYGSIVGADGTNANGVAYMNVFADGTSSVTVNLNILPATSGKHFLVWLSNDAKSTFVLVGELNSIVGDARHSLSFDTKEDTTSLSTVLISDESSASSEKPSVLLAEGLLKTVNR